MCICRESLFKNGNMRKWLTISLQLPAVGLHKHTKFSKISTLVIMEGLNGT
jgi:hypothetical protein